MFEQLPRLLPLRFRRDHPLFPHPRQGIPELDREVLLQADQQLMQRVHRRVEPFRLLDVLGESLREEVVRVVPTARVVGDDLPEGVSQECMDLPDRDTQELPHLGQLIEGERVAVPFHHRQHGLRECPERSLGVAACGIEAGDDRGLHEGRQELRAHQLRDLLDLTPDLQQALGRAVQDGVVAVEHFLDKTDAAEVRADAGVLDSHPLEAPVRRRDALRQPDLAVADPSAAASPRLSHRVGHRALADSLRPGVSVTREFSAGTCAFPRTLGPGPIGGKPDVAGAEGVHVK